MVPPACGPLAGLSDVMAGAKAGPAETITAAAIAKMAKSTVLPVAGTASTRSRIARSIVRCRTSRFSQFHATPLTPRRISTPLIRKKAVNETRSNDHLLQ